MILMTMLLLSNLILTQETNLFNPAASGLQPEAEITNDPGRYNPEYHSIGAKTGEETRDIILKQALKSLEAKFNPGTHRFSIKVRWIPASLLKIAPEDILSVEPEEPIDYYTNFTVDYKDGASRKSVEIQLLIDTERRLPVARKRILNGESITRNDLRMAWVSVPRDRGQLVSTFSLLEGKVVRRTLAIGQPVRHADIGSSFLIEAGEPVQLIYEDKGVKIEITGEARQNGAQDEEIRIFSKETRKTYLGRVIGPGAATWQRTL